MTNNPPSAQIKPGEYGFPLKLKARYDNFIGGEWVAPADGEYYQNLTPVTGQLLCEVASSGKRDIDLALDAAHKVKDKWAHTSVQDRAAILFKIADHNKGRRDWRNLRQSVTALRQLSRIYGQGLQR